MNGLRRGCWTLAVLGAVIFFVRDASAQDAVQQKAKLGSSGAVADAGEIFLGRPSADFDKPSVEMRRLLQQFAAHPPAGGILSTRRESSGVRVLDLTGMQAAGLLPKPGQLAGPGLVGELGWLATPQGMPDHQPPDFGELIPPSMPSPDPDPETQTYQDRIDALVAAAHRNAESHLARARRFEAEGSIGAAMNYFELAARLGTPEVRQQAIAELQALKRSKR